MIARLHGRDDNYTNKWIGAYTQTIMQECRSVYKIHGCKARSPLDPYWALLVFSLRSFLLFLDDNPRFKFESKLYTRISAQSSTRDTSEHRRQIEEVLCLAKGITHDFRSCVLHKKWISSNVVAVLEAWRLVLLGVTYEMFKAMRRPLTQNPRNDRE